MRPFPALIRITLAACLAAIAFDAATAQQVKTAADAASQLDKLCNNWGAAAKKAADGSAAQRTAAVDQASANLKVALEPIQFAPEVTDSEIASAVSKFRSCLDRAGRDAFGEGTSVTVSLNPHIKNARQPRTLDASIQAIPGPKVAVVVANKSLGKEWGEACLRQGSEACCSASATRECKDASLCNAGVKMCVTMVKCDAKLNECKKREMTTDKSCDGSKCKACTSDYKTCHDNAVSASY
jgi:hypothetical protein